MEGEVKSDDATISVQSQGNEINPAILLISGHASTCFAYGSLPSMLVQQGFRVITFDPRGLGRSVCEKDYSLHDWASDCIAVLDYFEVRKAHIWGSSQGGYVAQLVAVQNPERCSSLTLHATGLLGTGELESMILRETGLCLKLMRFQAQNGLKRGMTEEQYVNARLGFIGLAQGARRLPKTLSWLWWASAGASVVSTFYATAVFTRVCGAASGGLLYGLARWLLASETSLSPEDKREIEDTARKEFRTGRVDWSGEGTRRQKRAESGWTKQDTLNHRAAAQACLVPTLVVHGTHDPLFRVQAGQTLAETFPAATLLTIRGAGHCLPIASRSEWFGGVLKHLRQHKN